MEVLVVYLLSVLALIIGTAAIYMPLIPIFPYTWLYYHYHIRKRANWSILLGVFIWIAYISTYNNASPLWTIGPMLIIVLAIILTYKMHQDKAFPAVDLPEITTEIKNLPINNDMEMAVIEYHGATKCYPLD